MDLIPKPDQVASAASNVAHKVVYGGLADLRPMPRTLIDDGSLREVYHYRPQKKTKESGDPVLLVTPLAAPSLCYDLRRGCSLVEHFVQQGRPTYLVEYGEISFKNRKIGLEHWVDEVVPEAIRAASEHAGGRPVHVIGWSLGGIFASLAAAAEPDLPIASLTVVGTPFDVTKVPMVAPLRPILRLTDGGVVTQLYRLLGAAPKPLVRRAFQLSSGTKLITKPLAILQNLDDSEWLAQIEAVDRFTDNMLAYPGRSFGQLYHRMLKANQLLTGKVNLSGTRDRRRRDHRARADLRRQHRRHRPDQRRQGAGAPAAQGPRGPVRDRPRRPPRHAHRSGRPRHDLGDDGRVDRAVLHSGRAAGQAAYGRQEGRQQGDAEDGTEGAGEEGRAYDEAGAKSAKPKPAPKPAGSKSSGKVSPDRSAIGSNPERRFDSASSRNLTRKS